MHAVRGSLGRWGGRSVVRLVGRSVGRRDARFGRSAGPPVCVPEGGSVGSFGRRDGRRVGRSAGGSVYPSDAVAGGTRGGPAGR